MKRLLSLALTLALLITLLPPFGSSQVANAATGSFSFPTEKDLSTQARVTTDPSLTLTGSITGVDPSSVSYSVTQIINNKGNDNPTDDQLGSKRENITSNIYINGFSIQVFNVELFPGLNRITFKGVQGGGEVTNSIYIEYHNGPVFYDLVAQLDGNKFNIEEAGTTVVHSAASAGRQSADISITGFAPNAQQVTVDVNGSSKTYSVNSSNSYQFAASPITIQKGKNLVTIKVKNANQTVETTREVAFYNGEVTFYDVNLNGVANSAATSEPLEYNPNLLVSDPNTTSLTGKIIVPNYLKDDDGNGTLEPHPNPAANIPIKYTITASGGISLTQPNAGNPPVPTTEATPVGTYTGNEAFFIYQFTTPIGANHINTLAFDKSYSIQITAENAKKDALGQPADEGTGLMGFSLKDATKKFIENINYLSGYRTGNGEALSGTPLEGANLYTVPFAMEVLVGNPSATDMATPTNLVSVTDIKNVSGTSAPSSSFDYTSISNIENVSSSLVNKFVNVNGKVYKREILIFKKLPFEGTQTVTLNVGGVTKQVKFTMLFGPYVSYTSVFDNMTVYDDTNKLKADRIAEAITGTLSDFKGILNNINNTSEIRYDFNGTAAQTVFFYVNNTPIKLAQGTSGVTSFTILNAAERTKAFDSLFSGENEIKFVFQGSKNSYEKKIKLYFIPTNIPVIPVEGTIIYPYGAQYSEPVPNDPNFVNRGSVFTTNEAFMNIFGTFDFIDFTAVGATDADIVSNIQAKITQMDTPANGLTDPSNYILKIENSNFTNPIAWDLSKKLFIMRGTTVLGTVNNGAANEVANLAVRYDILTKTFSFILVGQELNPDGSSSVYTFTVFNNGETGPKASYRLEVDPTSLPYKVLRPILPAKNIVNQNYVEVVIDAPGAQTITINKQVAEKIDFDSDNNPATVEQFYKNTYRVFVSNLKVGKNKIDFIISSANDKVQSSIEITYAPTNIPGAQFLQTMASSHKIFDGALNLKFEKGTTLIRTDFNVPAALKNQVFTGHNLLFAIANSEDGVVDRRELEALPPNYNIILESFGTRFRLSYPTRFTKASPVYWIDAGLADDPATTSAYDPLTMGVDPYQFPNATGKGGTKIPTYDERPDNRELVTSKTGTLTLAFDPNMKDSIGTIITVYRYDVKAKYWENIGGTVDVKKNTITVPFNKFGYYVVGKMVYSYTDMTSHPYARNFLEAIYSKGIMNAAGFDDFGANIYISRGEFARMMVKALDIPLNYELSKPHFDDVPAIINPDALWDYRYVETAAREGIIRGTGPRTFQPSANLTREEASVIIARALDLKLATDSTKIDKDLEKTFKDAGSVNFYAKSSVIAIAKKKYIIGSLVDPSNPKAGSVFEPRSNLLRSDAAIIVARILTDMKKLPSIG
ncbi:S-layer homology domain-containing protein [Candidatus Pristimantibacillus sp. PTI5]|uniref:S-layer homology domain-containing protein n=1 Tax=Candidatus Pristimantibacillus sp. PTI5 TaxID=3400422 RepID=UPI003B02C6BC